jgi:hypothetical protein
MNDDLHNLNDLIPELEGLAIRTSQGTFVKMEDVRRLVEKRNAATAVEDKVAPQPKTLGQAREQAKKFLAEQTGLKPLPNLGRSIAATDSQPPSRA